MSQAGIEPVTSSISHNNAVQHVTTAPSWLSVFPACMLYIRIFGTWTWTHFPSPSPPVGQVTISRALEHGNGLIYLYFTGPILVRECRSPLPAGGEGKCV